MKNAAKDRMTVPMAPMVLNTFAMPTPSIQAGTCVQILVIQ